MYIIYNIHTLQSTYACSHPAHYIMFRHSIYGYLYNVLYGSGRQSTVGGPYGKFVSVDDDNACVTRPLQNIIYRVIQYKYPHV